MPTTDTSRQLHLVEPDGLAARHKLGNEGVAAPHDASFTASASAAMPFESTSI